MSMDQKPVTEFDQTQAIYYILEINPMKYEKLFTFNQTGVREAKQYVSSTMCQLTKT